MDSQSRTRTQTQIQTFLPSPTSSSSSNIHTQPSTPKQQHPRSDPNSYPTTFVQADTTSFKQVVQMLTGSPSPTPTPKPNSQIPPIKTPTKSKLYERRSTTLKNLRLTSTTSSALSPHRLTPDILSPSLLDFPSLVLSPVTPLIHDPFTRSPSPNVVVDPIAEQKAIAEKGFFLHPSPVSTPRDSEPRLLPLFPLSSPRVSPGSNNP